MAFNILDIINSSGIKQKAVSVNDTFTNIDTQLNKNFLDAIRNGTTRIAGVDCTDNILNNSIGRVGNFVEENFKFKNIVKNVGIVGDFGKIDNELVNFICHTINSYFKTVTSFLEATLKILLNILKKIDKMKSKVESTLLQFSKELRDCFIRMALDAKFGLERIVRNTVSFDGILELMQQCECVMELIKEKFPACSSAETPDELILCLKTQYSLSPETIINNLNSWTKNYITDSIENGFNIIDQSIQTILESLILPFRALVKQYCKELNKKRNVNFLLATDPSIRCLFEYSIETDKNGVKFYGMSVIDMINSMKMWSSCIDLVCSSLHDDIRRKIQSYNEQLRLDFKYWNSEITLDIYFACLASDLEASKIRPTAIRELYKNNKGKGIFTEITDFYKDIGKFIIESSRVDESVTLGEAVTKVLDKEDEEESDHIHITDGSIPFNPGVEPRIIQLYQNLGVEVQNDLYYRKIAELGNWDYKFKKSSDYIKSKEDIISTLQNPTPTTNTPIVSSTETNISLRINDLESYKSPTVPVVPTYEPVNDYVTYNIPPKPEYIPGEGLSGQYKRWFDQIT